MNHKGGDRDPAFPVMAMDILGNVLGACGNPGELGAYLTEEIRSLTGARCVLLVQSVNSPAVTTHRVVSVNPVRRDEWAKSPTMNGLYDAVSRMPIARFWRGDEPPEATGVLVREGFALSMAFPLNAGTFRVGAMLVLGLPDEEHISSVLNLLNALSSIVALVLRNSFLFERQEQTIRERTAELRNANEQLQIELAERKRAEEGLRTLNEELEQRVRERTVELERKNEELYRMNRIFIGRELRMVELKEKVAELERKLAQ